MQILTSVYRFHQLLTKAGFGNVDKDNLLSVFLMAPLRKLLRRPAMPSILTRPLSLAGEWCRTDGVQIQFLCGRTDAGPIAAVPGAADQDEAVAPEALEADEVAPPPDGDEGAEEEDDSAEEEDNVVDDALRCPEDIHDMHAVDPGRENLFSWVTARRVTPEERPPGLQPTGDGEYVVWDKVNFLHISI
jgi:hypothetical protein